MSGRVTRRITYDLPRLIEQTPKAGDFLKSISRVDGRTLSVYLITRAREVRRRKSGLDRRFALTVQIGYSALDLSDSRCWTLYWFSRKRK